MGTSPQPDDFKSLFEKDRQKLEEQIRSPKSPYIPGFSIDNTQILPAGIETVTSGTFVNDQWVFIQKQHPLVEILAIVSSGAGTSGEWQFVHNGTSTVLQTGTFGPAAYAFINFSVDVSTLAGWNNTEIYRFDTRRTAGANSVGIVVVHSLGKTSSSATA